MAKQWYDKLTGIWRNIPEKPKYKTDPILTGAVAMRPYIPKEADSYRLLAECEASRLFERLEIDKDIAKRCACLGTDLYIDPRIYEDDELAQIKKAARLLKFSVEEDASMRAAKGFRIKW